jgi:hypothetical protein
VEAARRRRPGLTLRIFYHRCRISVIGEGLGGHVSRVSGISAPMRDFFVFRGSTGTRNVHHR